VARIDALDTRLITLLQADGRLPNTELARRLGVTEATVRKRISRLLRDGIVLIAAWTDPLKIGYPIYTFIQLQVEMAQIERVSDRLARLSEIFFVVVGTGEFDICAGALFRSNEHMYDFFTRHLSQIPGIQRTTTSSILRTVKRGYMYPVPGGGDAR
jgi:Lrp/AsnC family transcriptional regulator for asnA, asnC and gidA